MNQVPFDNSGALSHLGIQVADTSDVIAMRDAWMRCMILALEESAVSPELQRYLVPRFQEVADFMRNRPG